jgi:hypothetical protein
MQKIRTRYFFYTLHSVMGFSALFLGWFTLFGRKLATTHFRGMTDLVFSVLAIAVLSFLAFVFVPFFKGDKRWFAIPALLTAVFFVGTVMLWQVPITGVI